MMEYCKLETRWLMTLMLIVCFLRPDLSVGFSLNDEGFSLLRFREKIENDPFGALSNWKDDLGVPNPCSWFGVECSNGHIVALNLINMRLRGTLASELGNLAHIKSIILRNNSFHGMIPNKIRKLKLLDLGYNNFGDALPSPKIMNIAQTGIKSHRKLLQAPTPANVAVPDPPPSSSFLVQSPTSPSPSPSPSPSQLPPVGAPSTAPSQLVPVGAPSPSPSLEPSSIPNQPSTPTKPAITASPTSLPPARDNGKSKKHIHIIIGVVIGCSALVGIAALLLWRCNKVATVRPWATGLSGQLQKAFVTGVPKLKRSELEAACEDFSNVIGSTSFGTVYKGTLSSGVEIAVASVATPSAKDWKKHLETLFRKRIDMLSKVNHKNFVNLLGYCEEEEPFTRMIAFEYAPNGTLFEHLHIQEAEHLDWGMRIRIAMGMAYCLDYMHQLSPPIFHKNLNSSSVNLTEDYAAKVSDLGLCNDFSTPTTEQTPENNVYSFGVILFEIISGKIPYAGADAVDDWVIDFLKSEKPMIDMVDPTLDSFDADQLEAVGNLIRSCVLSDPIRRPNMREVTSRLKEITRITQDGATPKISPLWWAELEILSTEAT